MDAEAAKASQSTKRCHPYYIRTYCAKLSTVHMCVLIASSKEAKERNGHLEKILRDIRSQKEFRTKCFLAVCYTVEHKYRDRKALALNIDTVFITEISLSSCWQ